MKLLFSVPSGFHLRELVLPLKELLESDPVISVVTIVTPGAPYAQELFSHFGTKFTFVDNGKTDEETKNLLQHAQPDIVITNTSGLDNLDVPLLKAAKALGIPTFTFIASWDNVWKMERFKNEGKEQVLADHIAVWNTMMHDHLVRLFPEYDRSLISIVGAPRFDFFWHTDRVASKEKVFAALGLEDTTRPLIHFATTELYPMEYLVRAVHDDFKKQIHESTPYFYASVHPGGDMSKHKIYEKYGVKVRYSFGRKDNAPHPNFRYNPTLDDVYMLIGLFKHTNLLINHSSTVALESLVADVPVINVKYGDRFDWWRWYRSMVYRDFQQHYLDITSEKGTWLVHNKHELLKALHEYLQNPQRDSEARKKTVQKMITTTDGTASQQMLELIKKKAQ